MKNIKHGFFVTVVLLPLLLLFTAGCNSDTAVEDEKVSYLRFEKNVSRGIESWNENEWPAERIYWTYTAQKIRGNYTTGQSIRTTETDERKAQGGYLLSPVRLGPAPGLEGSVGPFSVGVWKFCLYGYRNVSVDENGEVLYENILYKGVADNYQIDAGAPEGHTVSFVLEKVGSEPGSIVFGDEENGTSMTLRVPEGQFLRYEAQAEDRTFVRVIVSDVTSGTPVVFAVSTTEVGENTDAADPTFYKPGDLLTLDDFVIKLDAASEQMNRFAPGVHTLQFSMEYQDSFIRSQHSQYVPGQNPLTGETETDGWASMGVIAEYPVAVLSTIRLTLSGDVNDLAVAADADAHNQVLLETVAEILKTGKTATDEKAFGRFNTLSEAVSAYNTDDYKSEGGSANPIILLSDNEDALALSLTKDVVIKMNGHFVNNLTVSGGKNITFGFDNEDDSRNYTFKDAKIDALSGSSDTVWVITDTTGSLDVNAPSDNMWLIGKLGTLKISAATTDTGAGKGVHLGTYKDSASSVTSVGDVNIVSGNLEIGGQASIGSLNVMGALVSMKAKSGALVKKIYIGSDCVRNYVSGVSSDTVYNEHKDFAGLKEIILNSDSEGTNKKYLYGVEGLRVVLPDFPFTIPTSSDDVFMHWSTKASPVFPGDSDTTIDAVAAKWGTRFADKDYVVAGVDPDKEAYTAVNTTNLYALYAKPVGGRIFNIQEGFNKDKYHFFGSENGSINEIKDWYNRTEDVDVMEELKGAAYYINSDSANASVYAVYTATDPISTALSDSFDVSFHDFSASVTRSGVDGALNQFNIDKTNGVNGWYVGTSDLYDSLKSVGVENVFLYRFWAKNGSNYKLYDNAEIDDTELWKEIPDSDSSSSGKILPVRVI